METRCPYDDCLTIFISEKYPEKILNQASNGFEKARCVSCDRPCTLKPLELLLQMEKKESFLAEQNSLTGGPLISSLKLAPLQVLLEDIRSLQNIGSIFRTADAMGFGQIHLTGICGIPSRKDVVKASLGAEEHVSWHYSAHSYSTLIELKSKGVYLLGLELTDSSRDIGQLANNNFGKTNTTFILPTPLCMVLGNEVSGVSEEAIALCDSTWHIPMKGQKESLNVAVAFGIAAFQLSKMRETMFSR